jgi:CheY-like chemotaxis protein
VKHGRLILLVEDNPDDVLLTLRAFERSVVPTEVVVARDGEGSTLRPVSSGDCLTLVRSNHQFSIGIA